MLQSIDKDRSFTVNRSQRLSCEALAGAIDVIADDVQAGDL